MTTKTKAPERQMYEGQRDDWYKDTSPEAMDMVSEGSAQKQGEHLVDEKYRLHGKHEKRRKSGPKDLRAGPGNEPGPIEGSGSSSRQDDCQDTGPGKRQSGGSGSSPRDAQSSN